MNSKDANKAAIAIKKKLKEIITECIENYNGECDFKRNVHQMVNERMYRFVKSSSLTFGILRNYQIKNSNIQLNSESDSIKGKIILEYYEKKDSFRFGGPGYRGNVNGEICQYPDYAERYYQWESFCEKWIEVTNKVCGNNRNNPSNKFMNNAAFLPVWGNNRSGQDTFSTNRHSNGGNLWGTPQIRKPLGGFEKISSNIYKSIYNFTLDLKSAINHYIKLEEAFKSKNTNTIENIITKDSIYTNEEPKIKITVEKIRDWSYFYNNDHIDQSGRSVRKDSLVYLRDVNKVNKFYIDKNERIKQMARKDFEQRN